MLFQSINVGSHEESNGPSQFCSSQTIGRQLSLILWALIREIHQKYHYYLDRESSQNHAEVGFIHLKEVTPQGRHSISQICEALLYKRKVTFLA